VPITDGARLGRTLAASARVDPAATDGGERSNETSPAPPLRNAGTGGRVVVAAPRSLSNALQAKALGATVVEVRLRQSDGSFRFALDEIARAAQGAKLVLLGSPNNPTGTT